MSKKIDYSLKIALMGDPSVGKTSLQKRYLGLGFKEEYLPTLGANFSVKTIKIDKKVAKVAILDLAGQRNFQVLREKYFRGVSGVLLVFDVIKPYDAEYQIYPWVQEILDYTNQQGVPLAIIANKIDLDFLRQIEPYVGMNVATDTQIRVGKSVPVGYFETSAKEGVGVTEAFEWLISELLLRNS